MATVAFVVGGCGAPATMPRPAHVSQRLRGGGPPVRRRLRDLVYMLPTLPHASQARQASTAAALMQRAGRAPVVRTNGDALRNSSNSMSIVTASRGVCSTSLPVNCRQGCQSSDGRFLLVSGAVLAELGLDALSAALSCS